MSILLSIDVGSGSAKAGLLDADAGRWVTFASHPIAVHRSGVCVEQDARDYLSAVTIAVDACGTRAPQALREVRAVCVTGQMRGFCAVDLRGHPVGPAITLRDRRSDLQARAFLGEFGLSHIYRVTGQRFDSASVPAKFRWLAELQPDTLRSTRAVLAPKDYVRLQLTGTAATDPTDAAAWLLYDLSRNCWDEDLVRFCGIDPGRLPEILPAVSVAGGLLPEYCDRWGMRREVPVAVGAGDDIAATGSGAVTPGDLYEHIGTTGSVFSVSDRIVLDPALTIECCPSEAPGRYWIGGSCDGAGAAIEQALRRLGWVDADRPAWHRADGALSRFLADVPAAAPLFLPYLGGERCPVWSARIRGGFAGPSTGIPGETRAACVYEGVGHLLRWILQEILRVTPSDGMLHSAGRAAGAEAFGRLRASLYGRPVVRSTATDAALLGAALIAGVAAGDWSTPEEGSARFRACAWTAHPAEATRPVFNKRFDEFKRLTQSRTAAAR